MKCKECECCKKGEFKSRPDVYVCTGVKEPFAIPDINKECYEYPEKRTLKPATKKTNSKYAVVITFSFDSEVSVLLFNDWNSAFDFVKKDVEEEYRIDTQENGWDSEYMIYEDDGRAVLATHFPDRDDVVRWCIGTVHEREEEGDE